MAMLLYYKASFLANAGFQVKPKLVIHHYHWHARSRAK